MKQYIRNRKIDETMLEKLRIELALLDQDHIKLNGKNLKASQCYYFGTDPLHVLFNTNCPDSLKEKIQAIISRYTIEDESSAQ